MNAEKNAFEPLFSIKDWLNWQEFEQTYCTVCRYYDTEDYSCNALECCLEVD